MKVILTTDVPNLGDEGDVVKVAAGYFRNFLSPKRMAIVGSPSNMKELEFRKKRLEKIRAERRSEAEQLASKLKDLEVTIRHRCGEKGQLYGAVTASDIAEALLAARHEIDRRKIVISTPIKNIGEVTVTLRVYTGVNVPLKVVVKPEADQEEEIMKALAKAEREKEAAERAAREEAAAAKAAAEAAGETPAEGDAAPAEAAAETPESADAGEKKKGKKAKAAKEE